MPDRLGQISKNTQKRSKRQVRERGAGPGENLVYWQTRLAQLEAGRVGEVPELEKVTEKVSNLQRAPFPDFWVVDLGHQQMLLHSPSPPSTSILITKFWDSLGHP